MKKTLTSLVLLAIGTVGMAQSADEARQVAEAFLAQRTGRQSVVLQSVTSANGVRKAAAKESSNVYMFNAEGGGFAVVCSANGNNVVAGYSDSGTIDAENMPDALQMFLRKAQKAAASGQSFGADVPTVSPVAPLITTKWGQGSPFNGQCPGNSKISVPTGCVATAMAQILHYYKQNRGTGSLYYSYQSTEQEWDIDYSTTTYDWNNMLDSYSGDYNQTQADAVAKLMFEVGVACKMSYGTSESGASLPLVALDKYYGYNACRLTRDFYVYSNGGSAKVPPLGEPRLSSTWEIPYVFDTKRWIGIIQSELQAGRPIIYQASDVGSGLIDAPSFNHAFVIDGIDEKNFVHVNWGWSGMDDGYYDLTLLNAPSIDGWYDNELTDSQEMIVGIAPRESSQDYLPHLVMTFPLIDNSTIRVTANVYDSEKVPFAIVLAKDGEIKEVYKRGYLSTYYGNFTRTDFSNFIPETSSLPNGTYELRLAAWDTDTGMCYLCGDPSLLVPTVTVYEGTVTAIGNKYEKNNSPVVVESIEPASEIYASTPFYLRLTTTGLSGSTRFIFTNTSTGNVYGEYSGSDTKVKIDNTYDSRTTTASYRFKPLNNKNGFTMPAGTYKVESLDTTWVMPETYITVQPKPNFNVYEGEEAGVGGRDWTNYWRNHYEVYDSPGGVKSRYSHWYTGENYKASGFCPYEDIAYDAEGDAVTVKLFAIDYETGEEQLVAVVDTVHNLSKSVPLPNTLYPLEGLYSFRVTYTTSDGVEHTGLTPGDYSGYSKYHTRVYELTNTKNGAYKLAVTGTANVPRKVAANNRALSVNIQNKGNDYFSGTVTARFYNADYSKILAEVTSDDFTLEPEKEQALTFAPELATDETCNVRLVCTWSGSVYYYLTDETLSKIACLEFDPTGTTGIQEVLSDGCGFAEGEAVSIYAADGVLLRTVKYSASTLRDLKRQMPSGVYVLKSSTASKKVAW